MYPGSQLSPQPQHSLRETEPGSRPLLPKQLSAPHTAAPTPTTLSPISTEKTPTTSLDLKSSEVPHPWILPPARSSNQHHQGLERKSLPHMHSAQPTADRAHQTFSTAPLPVVSPTTHQSSAAGGSGSAVSGSLMQQLHQAEGSSPIHNSSQPASKSLSAQSASPSTQSASQQPVSATGSRPSIDGGTLSPASPPSTNLQVRCRSCFQRHHNW